MKIGQEEVPGKEVKKTWQTIKGNCGLTGKISPFGKYGLITVFFTINPFTSFHGIPLTVLWNIFRLHYLMWKNPIKRPLDEILHEISSQWPSVQFRTSRGRLPYLLCIQSKKCSVFNCPFRYSSSSERYRFINRRVLLLVWGREGRYVYQAGSSRPPTHRRMTTGALHCVNTLGYSWVRPIAETELNEEI